MLPELLSDAVIRICRVPPPLWQIPHRVGQLQRQCRLTYSKYDAQCALQLFSLHEADSVRTSGNSFVMWDAGKPMSPVVMSCSDNSGRMATCKHAPHPFFLLDREMGRKAVHLFEMAWFRKQGQGATLGTGCAELLSRNALATGQLSMKVSMARVNGEVTHSAPSTFPYFKLSFSRNCKACARDAKSKHQSV